MKRIISCVLVFFITIISSIYFTGCSSQKIKLYNINTKTTEEINLEDYIAGVVAAEMTNTWPIEALKAQSILARTFTLDFIKNKQCKYDADISNDITEAQAYDSSKINDNIRKAVKETEGLVIKSNNEYIQAWFHANSGGITELASIGLNYSDKDPDYIKSINSPETADNSQNYKWQYTFTKSEVLKALLTIGLEVNTISNISINEKSDTGRAITLLIGNKTVNANTFRLTIGSTKLKSTLIKNITINNDYITFDGLGYGHGVGLSQWGAKLLAGQGKNYEYILNYYFNNIQIVKN